MKTCPIKILVTSLVLNLAVLVLHSHAAPGDVDLSFDPGSGVNGSIRAIAVQTDGKLVIGGGFSNVQGLVRSRIARLNADGSGDTNFNPLAGANNFVRSIAVQPGGRVLIGGDFTNLVDGTVRNRIARLNDNGNLDLSFDPRAGANGIVWSVALNRTAGQPDGKVLIGGDFTTINGTLRNRMARLNADGSLDLSFTNFVNNTSANNTIRSIAVQPDGKVLIGGEFTMINGTNRYRIARLNANGGLDLSFSNFVNNTIHSVAVKPDGKVLIGGAFTMINNISRNRIARLNADGSLDGSFNPGTGANGIVYSVVCQPDGKVLIGGAFTNVYDITISRNRIARLNADGSLDFTFDLGSGPDNVVYSVALQSDDKVLIGGDFTMLSGFPRSRIGRLNPDASVDGTFIPGTGPNDSVRSLGVQCGMVLIGGDFTGVAGTTRNQIARLNAIGSLDSIFNPGTRSNGIFYAVALQPDGKALIGGAFTTINGAPRYRIARLNLNGSLDNSFTNRANNIIRSIAVQPDGKVLIGGDFIGVDGTSRYRIARLNANGGLDLSFSNIVNNIIRSIAVQPDGKVLIGGDFGTINSISRVGIARLNTNGTLDTTFNPGTGAPNGVYSVVLQPDGRVLIGGAFTMFNNMSRIRIARLNADGTLDPSFDPGAGANNTVNSIALQWNGKVIVGGAFTMLNDLARKSIGRLMTNGIVDGSFNPGFGANGAVNSIAVQPDGNVLVGGDFDTFHVTPRSFLVRLFGDPPPSPSLAITGSGANVVVSWPTNSFRGLTLQTTLDLTCPPVWIDSTGVPAIVGTNFTVTNMISGSQKFYRLKK